MYPNKIPGAQLWESEAVHDPMDVSVSNRLSGVVELIITQYQWLFQVRTQPCMHSPPLLLALCHS